MPSQFRTKKKFFSFKSSSIFKNPIGTNGKSKGKKGKRRDKSGKAGKGKTKDDRGNRKGGKHRGVRH